MTDVVISAEELRRYAACIISGAGSIDAEARIVAEHLVGANLRGHDSHGVGMIPAYVSNVRVGALRANQHATLVQDSGPIAIFDGNMGYGQVIASEATEVAIARADEHGLGIFGLRQTHHVGRVGAYAEQALAAGMVFIGFVNVITPSARSAPFGGRRGRYGTNPICIGFPAAGADGPVLLDFATTGLAAGKIRVARHQGKSLPPGMLIDGQGMATTDPAVFFEDRDSSMLSFGGYKASGLALACELLAGALTGSGVIREAVLGKPAIRNGMLGIVLDPARFGALDDIRAEAEAVIDWVKSAPSGPDSSGVMIAGDPERRAMAERAVAGIAVDGVTWAELGAAASLVGAGPPDIG